MGELVADNWYGIIISALLLAALVVLIVQFYRNKRALESARADGRKQADELREQTEIARKAAQAKGDFLSRMSHEIRTPLNVIIGMAHIAQNTQDTSQMHDSLARVEANSKHLLGIVNNILDFAKLESGNVELEERLFSLTTNLEFVMGMFKDKAEEKNIKFTLSIGDINHDGLITDSLRLNQVLINLLANAIKFTEAGEIKLKAEELYYAEGEGVYRFAVSDTGIGMDPKRAGTIFTSFTQAGADTSRVFGGTGLGLAIAQNLVALFGGEIELETALGLGSYFSFTIRVKAQEAPLVPGKKTLLAQARDMDLSGKRIMVVDDIEINREIVLALLKDTGADMVVAENGRQALDLFKASPVGHFDLILMDLQMPLMDGYTATRHIRALQRPDARHVIISAVSANALKEDISYASEVGMNGYLVKPIDVAMLYQSLGEWL